MICNLTLEDLQRKIQRNKKYKRMLEAFQTHKLYNIPLKRYTQEVETIHISRNTRTLINFCDNGSARLVDELIRANLQDQGNRSRLTEIHIQCVRASAALTESLKKFKDYALLKYEPYLRKIKTKGERASFLDTVLEDFYTYIYECELVINLASIVIKDIDQTGWSLERTIKALSLNYTPERKL